MQRTDRACRIPNNLAPTRRSLISRLRDWEDRESWQDFFDTYSRLIYSVAIKSGLTSVEAEEAVQETVVTVAKKMGDFVYDPQVCSFKGWLMHVTRLRIIDQFQKRKSQFQSLQRNRDSEDTATVERIPDPNGMALEQIWDEEWEQNLLQAAMDRVKIQIRPDHYQIFYMSAVQQYPPRTVARMLGASVGKVYLVRHRVAKRVKLNF